MFWLFSINFHTLSLWHCYKSAPTRSARGEKNYFALSRIWLIAGFYSTCLSRPGDSGHIVIITPGAMATTLLASCRGITDADIYCDPLKMSKDYSSIHTILLPDWLKLSLCSLFSVSRLWVSHPGPVTTSAPESRIRDRVTKHLVTITTLICIPHTSRPVQGTVEPHSNRAQY